MLSVFGNSKIFTAQEMGMRVDHEIDERMNIVSASRGAAKYIKQNNWYFNNWVHHCKPTKWEREGFARPLEKNTMVIVT
ncbi:MAG: hypothetical protein QM734_00095 [Cyclobacteriaceae bacterium]